METLSDWGWEPFFRKQLTGEERRHDFPARIVEVRKEKCRIVSEGGGTWATVTGRLRHAARGWEDLPAVGDWVVARGLAGDGSALIDRVLLRKSRIVRTRGSAKRRGPGSPAGQVLAANVDAVFLVSALNRELNARRIERYLALAWGSGGIPVVLLNKADVCGDVDAVVHEVREIAPGADVIALSALTKEGIDRLDLYLTRGKTVVLLGSSGVGKSSLVNALAGDDVMAVGELSEDDKGRHTTASRNLIRLPCGAMVIDTPGLRALQLAGDEDGVEDAFEDIAQWAESCRFSDCRHESEPGCAVLRAVEEGRLGGKRLESYRKLKKEIAFHRQVSKGRTG